MRSLEQIRADKPASYPDQSIYAEFAATTLGLTFLTIDDGSGFVFCVKSKSRHAWFGSGRCSYFPQNTATAATLAADKYLSAIVMEDAGIPSLGGAYFFLSDRHRSHRPDGHERADAVGHLRSLGGKAFVKPLVGSRGDFAQAVDSERALRVYFDDAGRHYDSIIMQRIMAGDEYRVFVLDDAVLYSARKQTPYLVGDGVATLRELLRARDAALDARGISPTIAPHDLDGVPAAGERRALPGRMNRSAGGGMTFAQPPAGATDLAIKAVRALGLRAGGVDLFTGLAGAPSMRVIEINANPSIRFLEDSGRDDLILAIWRHGFAAMGLLDV